MELPFLKKHKEETTTRQYLLAIEISPSVVKSAVWTVINGITQMLAAGHPATWDDRTSESLLAAIDKSVTAATNHLDPTGKIIPEQAMLGLSATWVHEDKIVPEKLRLLKEVSGKLDLKLVGFVVTPEAVVKYLHHSEHVPPTAILLGFWQHHLELTLVKLGKIVGIQLVNRSASVVDDVVEGLSRFAHVDMLPSRMLLYDSGINLEDIKQLLLAHPWQASQKKLPFLHFPKIEILPSEYTVKSIALAGGTEVAKAIGMIPADEPEVQLQDKQELVSDMSDLGFVENIDVAAVHQSPAVAPSVQPEIYAPQQDEITAETTAEYLPPIAPRAKFSLPKLPPIFLRLPRFNFSLPKSSGLIAILVAVAVLIALASAYWFLPKATVVLAVSPRQLQQEFEVTAVVGGEGGDGNVLSATSQEVSVSDNKSVATTGNKTIGDKASGSVVILNSTDTPRKLAVGTVLSSPAGLRFILEEEVTVASASGSVFNPQLGKATARVVSAIIGTDSNLSAGTEFRVGNFATTQIAAKNEQALSGGSSRQVKAVAKADLLALSSGVLEQLRDQARDQLTQGVLASQTIIPESITLETISEDYSHKLDDATDNVSLTSKVRARGLVIEKSQLEKIVADQIQPLIPEGYSSISSQSQTFEVKEAEETSVVFSVKAVANLLPEIDVEEVAKAVAGKYPDKARDYLSQLPAVSQINIAVVPKLPGFLATLPRVAKNISISVTAAQ